MNLTDPGNDPLNYKWGLFYWNPNDKRIFVPKATGLGLTVNFANPVSYIILAGIWLIVLFFMNR